MLNRLHIGIIKLLLTAARFDTYVKKQSAANHLGSQQRSDDKRSQ